ncbi:hypothetical protein F4553_003053 [Allocatelliglobosispora scoriae]|uniref:DUF2637 domain-containing protein n=1 Tax=Allocatelliglobosispora scoriae TaxID=643052 RepID=A0A841BN31_9ACTN|nr:hypothetical protein [Allocatelliglobosispora scoriae]MBB5869674.1 hypothetical protein [Allocatelliglobosispora scoriae]
MNGTQMRSTGPLHLLGVFYVGMAGIALYGQSDGLMTWVGVNRPVALAVALAVELLAAVLFAFADWRRTQHGEQAVAARLLSVAVALGVAAMNFYGHEGSVGTCALYTGASLAGYAVWVLHTNARRRDSLRAAGKLTGQPPVYGLGLWLRMPRTVWRARTLATANTALGVHDSIGAALSEKATTDRHRAIAAALRRKLSASLDSVSADIAMVSYDLEEVAARLAASVDYGRLTGLLAADIDPDRINGGQPSVTAAMAQPATDGEADKPQRTIPARAPRTRTAKPDAAARVAVALAENPTGTQKDIARAAKTTDRTVRRVLSANRADTATAVDADTASTNVGTAELVEVTR